MQTSSKAFSIRSLFRVNLPKRKRPLTAEEDSWAGISVSRSFTIRFGDKRQATFDIKCIVSIVTSVVMYFLAAFLANEWLYLLACAMIMAALVGTILPVLMLNALAIDCWLPDKSVAREDGQLSVLLRYTRWIGPAKYLLPMNALRLRIILARRTAAGFQPHKDLGEQSILLHSVGHSTLISLCVPHLERGVYRMSHVSVCTGFPFGFVWWQRQIVPSEADGGANTIVVYPSISSMRGNFLLQIKGMLSTMGMAFSERLSFTQSTSVRGLREFRVGDSLRHIHWPSTARQSKLLVREFDSETLPIFDLYFDLTAPWVSREQFELAVCIAHSLVHFGYERDMLPELFLRPALDAPELELLMQDLPNAQPPLEMLSEILARVEPIKAFVPAPDLTVKREILALVPSSDKVLRATSEGDQVVAPVLLVALPPDAAAAVGTNKQAGHVVATIYSAEDLETL